MPSSAHYVFKIGNLSASVIFSGNLGKPTQIIFHPNSPDFEISLLLRTTPQLATLKANGTGIIKPLARLARGCWEPERMESMKPSVTTKLCALCAAIYLAFPTDICYIFLVRHERANLNDAYQ